MELAGKIAIVTGGDTGIGKAIACMLARAGAAVLIDYVGEGDAARAIVEASPHRAALRGRRRRTSANRLTPRNSSRAR